MNDYLDQVEAGAGVAKLYYLALAGALVVQTCVEHLSQPTDKRAARSTRPGSITMSLHSTTPVEFPYSPGKTAITSDVPCCTRADPNILEADTAASFSLSLGPQTYFT